MTMMDDEFEVSDIKIVSASGDKNMIVLGYPFPFGFFLAGIACVIALVLLLAFRYFKVTII